MIVPPVAVALAVIRAVSVSPRLSTHQSIMFMHRSTQVTGSFLPVSVGWCPWYDNGYWLGAWRSLPWHVVRKKLKGCQLVGCSEAVLHEQQSRV